MNEKNKRFAKIALVVLGVLSSLFFFYRIEEINERVKTIETNGVETSLDDLLASRDWTREWMKKVNEDLKEGK